MKPLATPQPDTPASALTGLFNSGVLVRPSDTSANLVHLVRAVATASGVPDLASADRVSDLVPLIGSPPHVVFVLLDGLGMNIVRRLPADSFCAHNLKRTLHSVCPSTTACALTCVATGQYANRHAVAGWFTHLPHFRTTAVTLPFAERFSNLPLSARGVGVRDLLPAPPLVPRMKYQALTIVPANIADSTYNNYSRGDTPGLGYLSIADAVTHIVRHVRHACGPTYTHLYLPEIDSACHKKGAVCEGVFQTVLQIDRELARLADGVAGRATVVVTADHGLIDVPAERQQFLFAEDPALDLLLCPPSGDARMPIFHCEPGRRDEFAGLFRERYGADMLLVPTSEVERLELLGPGPLSDHARPRFGDYIAFPFRPTTLAYHPPNKTLNRDELFKAVHAGLSPEEMEIPLIVAS